MIFFTETFSLFFFPHNKLLTSHITDNAISRKKYIAFHSSTLHLKFYLLILQIFILSSIGFQPNVIQVEQNLLLFCMRYNKTRFRLRWKNFSFCSELFTSGWWWRLKNAIYWYESREEWKPKVDKYFFVGKKKAFLAKRRNFWKKSTKVENSSKFNFKTLCFTLEAT